MKFHTKVLSKKQKKLLSFIKKFKENFILVWGTAIALQLWHRESIDFDLFFPDQEKLPIRKIEKEVKYWWKDYFWISKDENYHRTIIIDEVKITWFAYMYPISEDLLTESEYFKLPSLLHLAAMKIHAIWQRAKWKDYVDIYFLIKKFWLEKILDYTKNFFWWEINKRLFCSQLSYYDDIDYTEKVSYLPGFKVWDDEIKKFLSNEWKKYLKNIIE